METLEQRLRSLAGLPAVPAALTRLISILSEDEPDTREIELMVQSDRALSLSALRMANSAAYGSLEPLSSVEEAVRRLGTRNLMKVAITHFSSMALDQSGRGYGLEGQEAWEGALAGGVAAEVIAAELDSKLGVDGGVAFTAGLLRDCGKLAMDQLIGVDELKQLLLQKNQGEQLDLEQSEFGFDHAEVGAALAKMWDLGEQLQQAIRYHHDPPSDGSAPLAEVIYVADMICAHLGYGIGLDGMNYVLHSEILEHLGIDQRRFSALMETVACRLAEFESHFAAA